MPPSNVEGFNTLSACVSLYQPKTISILKDQTPGGPSLIVICSWMGAATKYIAKYTQGYQDKYPSATILLVRCTPGALFQRLSLTKRQLAPACEIIRSHASLPALTDASVVSTTNPSARILLHAFSNGGATMAMHLVTALQHTPATPSSSPTKLPFTGYILDCAPGNPNINQAVLAFSIGLPKLIRFVSRILLRIFLTLYTAMTRILRREDMLTALRRRLNDPRTFDLTTPRLYLYSKSDQMVGWQDVESHARDARSKGFKSVREVTFKSSAHCALVMDGREVYWGAVERLLKAGSAPAAPRPMEITEPVVTR